MNFNTTNKPIRITEMTTTGPIPPFLGDSAGFELFSIFIF